MKQSSAVKSRLLRIYIFFLLLLLIQRSEAAVPTAITVPAKRITYTSCILNCLVNPNGASTTISFEYGFTKSYDSTLSISGTISGSATLYKEVQLKNLIPGRTYHFRVKAVNASGTSYGQDFTFNTSKNFGSSHSAAHTVVVNTDGVVFAYGYNVTGQLGDNTTSHKYVPYKVLKGAYNGTTYLGDNTSNPIIAVSAGIFHTIALAADGSVYTFGTNKNGQIGDNTSTDRYTPVRVLKGDYNGTTYLGDNSANPIIAVSAGSYHSLALAADGTVYAFGYNSFGQIGDSSTTDRRVPAKVLMGGYKGNRYLGDNSNNPIVSISAGGTHNMVLSAEGLVYSFGDNTYGQLGDSTNTTRITPVKVLKGSHPGTRFLGDNKPIYAVAAGGRHSLILSSSGMVCLVLK
jgi:alpha-tubulin suppressor-like RCC1 family protein